MGKTLPVLIITALFTTACMHSMGKHPDPRGVLRFSGTPREAHIEIDDIRLGPLHMFEKDGVLLRPGRHRIVARADGFFPLYRIVEIAVGETVVLEIELRPTPP